MASRSSIPSSLEPGWEEAGGGDPWPRLAWQVRQREIRKGAGERPADRGRTGGHGPWTRFGGTEAPQKRVLGKVGGRARRAPWSLSGGTGWEHVAGHQGGDWGARHPGGGAGPGDQAAPWGRGAPRLGYGLGARPDSAISPAGSSSPRSTGRASTRWCHRVCWASCAARGGRRARSGCAGAAARSGPSASWCPRAPAPPRAARTSRPRARPPRCWPAAPARGARAGTPGRRASGPEGGLGMGLDARRVGRK